MQGARGLQEKEKLSREKTKAPLLFEKREPCKSCPYRTDAPIGLWSEEEFVDLLANDRTQMGTLYGCHEYRKRKHEAQVCVGWLINQRERNVPSMMLRITLMSNKQALACYNEANSPVPLHSLEEMCAENGVEP